MAYAGRAGHSLLNLIGILRRGFSHRKRSPDISNRHHDFTDSEDDCVRARLDGRVYVCGHSQVYVPYL